MTAGIPKGVKLIAKGSVIDGTPDAEVYLFNNGLRLLVLPDNRNPVATLRIHLDAGSNRERPGITGLAHFFEHMMFRKTKERDEGEFDRVLSGVGGKGNAATGSDFVVYESVFPGPALDLMLDLERRRFRELDLKDPYFTTEKGAVISERRMRYENNPQQRGFEKLRAIVERGTQREWLTIGTQADVANMSITEAQEFYRRFYVPSNAVVSIGGPFRTQDVVAKVHKAFGDWSGEAAPAHRTLPGDYFTRDLGKNFVCKESVSEQVVQVVFPSSKTSYDDLLMSFVTAELLDDGPDGSLSRQLSNANLATAFAFYKTYWQHDSQPLVAYFRLSGNQKPADAIARLQQAIEQAKQKTWGDSFRKRLQKRIDLDMASASEKMTTLVENYEWNLVNYGDHLVSKRFQQLVNNLTVRKLQAWMQANIDFKKSFTMGVTGLSESPPCDQLTAEGQR
jgi:predicted Zn-dependent peptidase